MAVVMSGNKRLKRKKGVVGVLKMKTLLLLLLRTNIVDCLE